MTTESGTKHEIEPMRIGDRRLVSVCKYRQGETCCKYIVYLHDHKGFYCSKKIPALRKVAEKSERARGDNCEGLPTNDAKS